TRPTTAARSPDTRRALAGNKNLNPVASSCPTVVPLAARPHRDAETRHRDRGETPRDKLISAKVSQSRRKSRVDSGGVQSTGDRWPRWVATAVGESKRRGLHSPNLSVLLRATLVARPAFPYVTSDTARRGDHG